MRIYQIALILLVFSLLTSVFNEIALFGVDQPEIGLTVNESEVSGVIEFNYSDEFDSEEAFREDIPDIGGPSALVKIWSTVKNFLYNAIFLGEVFKQYVPGQIGTLLGNVITTILLALYGIGMIQIALKVSTKGME